MSTPRYKLGDVVYLRVASEKFAGMIVSIRVEPSGTSYVVSWENRSSSYHYEIELTATYIPDFERDNESGEVAK